jgi:hypothetical protein
MVFSWVVSIELVSALPFWIQYTPPRTHDLPNVICINDDCLNPIVDIYAHSAGLYWSREGSFNVKFDPPSREWELSIDLSSECYILVEELGTDASRNDPDDDDPVLQPSRSCVEVTPIDKANGRGPFLMLYQGMYETLAELLSLNILSVTSLIACVIIWMIIASFFQRSLKARVSRGLVRIGYMNGQRPDFVDLPNPLFDELSEVGLRRTLVANPSIRSIIAFTK